MKKALVFPGQGSQFVGMGKELAQNFATAREVFEEVDEVVGKSLSKLMFEGPFGDLTLTANAQPAIMASSMAVLRVLEKDFGFKTAEKASFVAGHSLGEYSACCAGGVFSLQDTAKLLKTRGEAMQNAVKAGSGGMAAVLGVSVKDVNALLEACCEGGYVCVAANDNADGQVVLSGHIEAIDKACEIAKEFGAKRCIKLPVSAPFHSPLMVSVCDVMAKALNEVEVNKVKIPVISNVLAMPVENEHEVVLRLIEQITAPVKWRESLIYMAEEGVEEFVEIGSGKVLTGISKRSFPNLESYNVETIEDIEKFAKKEC